MLPITFLSDYGSDDEFAGVCHGVIQRIAPGAHVIDLTHGVAPRDVAAGGLLLRNAIPHIPAGVHLAVVDPGVGGSRRPVALRCADGRLMVGPDNGLLWPASERCGGAEAAADLSASPFRLEPVSATFHGRDLFAPVAARLALGAAVEEAGESFPPTSLVRLDFPQARVASGEAVAVVAAVDRFGNLQLHLSPEDMRGAGLHPGSRLQLQAGGGARPAVWARTFADAPAGDLVVLADSSGMVAVALNGGDASAALGARGGSDLRLSWEP